MINNFYTIKAIATDLTQQCIIDWGQLNLGIGYIKPTRSKFAGAMFMEVPANYNWAAYEDWRISNIRSTFFLVRHEWQKTVFMLQWGEYVNVD